LHERYLRVLPDVNMSAMGGDARALESDPREGRRPWPRASGATKLDREREILPLTGLRAVAAWWVVVFHFAKDNVPTTVLHSIAASGHVAVDLFFVLSGFVLARRYRPADVATATGRRAFWRRRLARVYPLYLASLALGFSAEWPRSLRDLATWGGALRLAGQAALLNAFCHKWMFRLNWAAWSLSVEAFFYLLFPWLIAWVSRRNLRPLIAWCAAAALVVPALYMLLDPDHLGRPLDHGDNYLWSYYLKFFPPQRLPMFVAGMAAALLTEERAPPKHGAAVAVVALVGIVATNVVPYTLLQGGALLLVFTLLVAALATDGERRSPIARWLGSRPLVALGHASYATYIFHVPLFLLFACFDEDAWTRPWLFLPYALALLGLSLGAYRFVEEPARRALTRWGAPPHPS
jgi:peptidoglycan/LPS O-acetylase OafA/YrhL